MSVHLRQSPYNSYMDIVQLMFMVMLCGNKKREEYVNKSHGIKAIQK